MAITEEAHRNIFGALGGAISAAGIVVGANWLATVAGASPDRRLSVNNLIFYFAIFCVVIGALVIAAAVTETKYLPLPGKRPIIQKRQREETNRQLEGMKKEHDALLKTFALRTLGGAHLRGQNLQVKEDLLFKEVSLWHTQVIDFIGTAWGVTYSTPFVSDIGRPIDEAKEAVQPILERLERFIERAPHLTLNRDPPPTSSFISRCAINFEGDAAGLLALNS